MVTYDIAIGTKVDDSQPKNYKWDWPQIVERLKNVTYAEHTARRYAEMSKKERTKAKDVGYFIGGLTVKRKVTYRQLLVLDIDYPVEGTLDALRDWLRGKNYVIHSTHTSTDKEPRYRVVTTLSRFVVAEEYGAIMRMLHEKLELPIDIATFDFNRIMFLPSVPKDVKYFFECSFGESIDVVDLLDKSDEWRDLSGLSVPKNVQVQDPKYKGGIIGAFCMKYPIREAIDTFLSDVWKKERNGRYTLAGASTYGGGVIYEDKYLYSNHSTDPHLGRSHNSYDAVRLYKFGEGKVGNAGMAALCESLGIKPDSGRPHALTVEGMEDEEAKAILQERLDIDNKGMLRKSLKNAKVILEYDPHVRDIFAYDLFSEMPVLKRMPPWREYDQRIEDEDCKDVRAYTEMEDVDESYLRLYFEEKYDFESRQVLQDALLITEHQNAFHPIRDYLNSLEWDGVKRLEKIFIDCFGVPDTLYAREVGIKFFTGAVRRVFIPSAKMDYIPVLVSDEGMGKSRFIKRMAKIWGSDTFYTFNGGKEAYEQLRGVWLLEIPELNGVQSRGTNSRKAFVTKGSDRYRSAYLKYTKTYKRQCVFIASSNDIIFLDDPSEDGRRWWGLMCNKDKIKIDVHSDEFLELVNKYWAEAVHYYKMGVLPMLSRAADSEAKSLRTVHKTENMEQGALIDYLNMPVPDDWYEKDTFEHKVYFDNGPTSWYGTPRKYICNAEVAREFFGYERKELNTSVGRKVSDAIEQTKLFRRTGGKQRFGEYGSAIAWYRIPESELPKEGEIPEVVREKRYEKKKQPEREDVQSSGKTKFRRSGASGD